MFFVDAPLFIYDNYINFIHTWGNFDWPIKVTPSVITVTPSAIKVTPFDGTLVFDSEYLQKNWSLLMEKV